MAIARRRTSSTALVREVIARSAGAEVRTEGDSFYVVFPSASAAVGAGLAIVAAAAEATAEDPEFGSFQAAARSLLTTLQIVP